jgi:hypothetical protein
MKPLEPKEQAPIIERGKKERKKGKIKMIYLPSPKEGGGLPKGNLVSQLVHNSNTTRRGVRPLKARGMDLCEAG